MEQRSPRQLSFAGAAFYPGLALGVTVIVAGGAYWLTRDDTITVVAALLPFFTAAALFSMSLFEYVDYRRGAETPATRLADNGERALRKVRKRLSALFTRPSL